ncbi:MAG TPA: gephyrin-like molybdotransferase Glp [Acidimicrobiia bacterium]|nr:gephyrin-like molybdotransferase Glp [Acidimicrobiia bacterium]
MRPLDEARAEVLSAMVRLDSERVELAHASGRVLAEDVVSPHDIPPFPNSAMDGFAVRAADVVAVPVRLEVLEDVPAGSMPTHEVGPATAIKIMTGAPMPIGADAVVKVEVTAQAGDGTVDIMESVAAGTAVRPAGGDISAGTNVLAAGTRLGPVEVALLATVGAHRPQVSRRPLVAVMSTGDELRPPDTPRLEPGLIRDSNRPLMSALVAEAGGDVLDMGIVADREGDLTAALDRASEEADVIMTSGGVSMGEYDLIKQVLTRRGDVAFWQVAMQPAKPFAFGRIGSTPLFGLPGNPVSVMVAFEQFARPALLTMQGATQFLRPRIMARMGEAVASDPAKVVFLRVVLRPEDGENVAYLSGGQGSNVLSALAAADGLAVVRAGVDGLAAGDRVEVELFRHPSRDLR